MIRILILSCLIILVRPVLAQEFQIMVLDIDVADIAYRESTDRLIVCTNTDTTYGNSLLIINPYTGEIESSTFIGSIPKMIELSSDEKWAYVTLRGANRIVRFDLDNKVLDQEILLAHDSIFFNKAFSPYYIACSENYPELFAITQTHNPSVITENIAIFEDAIDQHTKLNSIDAESLVFTDEDQLYGGKSTTLMKLSTNGPEIVVSQSFPLSPARFEDMKYMDNFIYTFNGVKIDLANDPVIAREFIMECSEGSGRPVVTTPYDSLLYLVGDRYNAQVQYCFEIFENYPPYSKIDGLPLHPEIEEVGVMEAWGKDKVALQIRYDYQSRNKLAIIRKCTYDSNITPVLSHEGIPGGCYFDIVTLTADSTYDRVFWSNGANSHKIYISSIESGEYYYQVVDSNGCLSPKSNTLNVSFTSKPDVPKIYPEDDTIDICIGQEVTLEATNSPGSSSSHWSDGTVGRFFTIDTTGLYTLQYITPVGCVQEVLDSIYILQRPFPVPDKPVLVPAEDTIMCKTDSITVYGPPGYDLYSWIINWEEYLTDQSSLHFKGPVSVNLELQVIDENACMSQFSDPVEILFYDPYPAPTITRTGNQLTSSGNSSFTYQWYLNGVELEGVHEKTITVSDSGFYQVKIINIGCDSELSDPFSFE